MGLLARAIRATAARCRPRLAGIRHNVAVSTASARPDAESLANARLWLAFSLMLFVSGFSNTFPVFFPPLLEEFAGSRAATASTVSLLWVLGALVGAPAGYL